MICIQNNDMAHYDFIMDIPSNIIAYCDVIMGHGTKKVVSTTWFPQKVVLWTESPMEICYGDSAQNRPSYGIIKLNKGIVY